MSVHQEAIESLEYVIEKKKQCYEDYKIISSEYEKTYLNSFEKLTNMDNEIKSLKDTMIFLIESEI